MRNIIIKPALAVAMVMTSVSPAFADPFNASSQSVQDLRSRNDMAAKAYFKFALGGKKNDAPSRFRSGLKLQMRNVMQSQNQQSGAFAHSGGNINVLDLSMGAKGFSSLQLNGVPLQQKAYVLNAHTHENEGDRAHRRGFNRGILVAGGVILAIGVAAAVAGGEDDDDHDDFDRDDRF